MDSLAATQMMINAFCPDNPPSLREIPPVPVAFIEDLDNPEDEIEEYVGLCEFLIPIVHQMITDPEFRDTHELVRLPDGGLALRTYCF
jgi:hypothetical protein